MGLLLAGSLQAKTGEGAVVTKLNIISTQKTETNQQPWQHQL